MCMTLVAACSTPRAPDPAPVEPAPSTNATPALEPAPEAAPAAGEAQKLAPNFTRPSQGWSVHVPPDWELLGEQTDEAPNGATELVVFGLPEVWSDLEAQNIANAIGVHAVQRFVDAAGTAGDAHAFRTEFTVLNPDLPQTPVVDGPRTATRGVVSWDGLDYEVQLEFITRGRMGYVIAFHATPGTFATNYPLFRKFSDSLELFDPKRD
jgi:hypothetical protein